ncbi:MAG: Crp/Fnr family transcriptional regulator [bacterium]|nr:Crp/Fnr family transcriptional regulator [bacterium]
MEIIKEYLAEAVELTEEYWQIFSSKLIERDFSKKSLILKIGQTENYLSFMEKGILRYFIPKENNDLTFNFSFENKFISAYDSFLTQTPTYYHVQALTDTKLWSISHPDLQYIYKNTSLGNLLGRLAAENLFLMKAKRELSLLNDSAEERYFKLFTEQPKLIKLIQLKYIASYIGVTPQALSRIRKRIS